MPAASHECPAARRCRGHRWRPRRLIAAEALAAAGTRVICTTRCPLSAASCPAGGRRRAEPHVRVPRFVGSGDGASWLARASRASARKPRESASRSASALSSQLRQGLPHDVEATPLLRASLHRLKLAGVRFHVRRRSRRWGGPATCSLKARRGRRLRCRLAPRCWRSAAPAGPAWDPTGPGGLGSLRGGSRSLCCAPQTAAQRGME